jgi:hypothetical protein
VLRIATRRLVEFGLLLLQQMMMMMMMMMTILDTATPTILFHGVYFLHSSVDEMERLEPSSMLFHERSK